MLCKIKKSIAIVLSCALIMTMCPFLSSDSVYAEETCDHDWSEWDEIVEPTCTDTGLLGRYCYICYKDEEKESPALGHKWTPWKIKRKATPYVTGYSTRSCEECYDTQKKTLKKRKITANEKKARAVVNRYLKYAKKYNIKKMNSCIAKRPKTYGYPQKNIHWVFKKHNKKIKWKVKNITGAKNAYTIHVSIKQPTIYSQTYNSYSNTLWWMFNQVFFNNKNADKMVKPATNRFIKSLKKKLKKGKIKTTTRLLKIPVIKTKKGWKIKKKTRTVVDIATGRYNEAMDNAQDDFSDSL